MIGLVIYIAIAFLVSRFRERSEFLQRLNDCNWQFLVLVDCLAAFVLFWPLYLLTVLSERPLPWTTISTMCGFYALVGTPWARLMSKPIDALFKALTSQEEHCLQSFLRWANPMSNNPSQLGIASPRTGV